MIKQQGATLAVTLLLLFVITLLGVSSIQVTHLQEKMSANLQDKELSFFAAETALKAGEEWLLSQQTEPSIYATCPAYPCVHDVYQNFNFEDQTAAWWQSNSAAVSVGSYGIATNPRYLIEFLQFVPDSPQIGSSALQSTGVYYYRITSRGTGSTDDAVSIIQSTAARRY